MKKQANMGNEKYDQRLAVMLLLLSLHAVGAIGFADCISGQTTPASFMGAVHPAIAVDINPDPEIVEINLTAGETIWSFDDGPPTTVYAYNNLLPGPTIQAEVGDRLIVNFCNALPVETTVHWHGPKTPANMDGSNIAQLTVPPGGSFRYDFPLLSAGTFWYHPHVRTNRQVERGLYGILVVRDPEEDLLFDLPTREHILVFDDVLLDEAHQIVEPFAGDRSDVALEQLNGREGDTLLLNGVNQPTLVLDSREPHRLRILNAANSRFLRLSIPNHMMWRIGGDQGLLEAPIEIPPVPPVGKHPINQLPETGLLMTPGERADVIIFPIPNDDGSPLQLQWHDWQRGRHSVDFLEDGTVEIAHNLPDGDLPVEILALIELQGSSTETGYSPPPQLVDIVPHSLNGAESLPLVFGHALPDWNTGEVMFFAQAMGKPFPVLTPDDVHTVGVNQTYIWEVKNLTGSLHNFHTHGFTFQPFETELVDLDVPGNNTTIRETRIENRDTVLLRRRPGLVPGRSWSITRLLVHFDDAGREGQIYAGGKVPTATSSGGWLLHCHILEHSARGMMSFFQVDSRLLVDGFESGDLRRWSSSSP